MGYVNVDTIYEEEGKEKIEIKNDYTSVEEKIGSQFHHRHDLGSYRKENEERSLIKGH